MTEAEAVEAILQRWVDAWPALHPDVPYVFDNEQFEAPTSWARVTVLPSLRQQETMGPAGGRRFGTRGDIFVQLFGDADVGARPLALLAASVRTVFEARVIGSEITTYAGTTRVSPPDGRWHMTSVTVPFWFPEQS